MTTELPAPLTPLDCDLQDFPFMPLHVARLRDSDFAMAEHPEACWYGVLLWSASWHQLPAASLPDDDVILTRMVGLGRDIKTFRRRKAGALRGFVKCADGRLYHPIVAEVAIGSWAKKLEQRWRTECARRKKAAQRSKAEYRAPAFDDWLRQNGHGDMVRHVPGTNVESPGDSGVEGEGQPPVCPEDMPPLSPDFLLQERGIEREKRIEEIEPPSQPTVVPEPARAFADVCAAAGYAPTAKVRDAEQARLAGWLDGWNDVDLVKDVLAPIRQFVLDHPGLTHSLKRFDKTIADRKARAMGSLSPSPNSPPPPPPAMVDRTGEGDGEASIRVHMAKALGDRTAANWIDPLGLRLNGEALHVTAPSAFLAEWATSNFADQLRAAATTIAGREMRVEVGVDPQRNTTGGGGHGEQDEAARQADHGFGERADA